MSNKSNEERLKILQERLSQIHEKNNSTNEEGIKKGFLLWEINNNVNDTLYYFCKSHSNMGGIINFIYLKGDTGATGIQGNKGFSGATGFNSTSL